MLNKPIPINTRVDKLLLDRIDDWRRAQADIPPRSEAMRALIERGLDDEPARSTEDTAAA
jgi:hypothetical protein